MNHYIHTRVEYDHWLVNGKKASEDIAIFYNDYEVYERSCTRYYKAQHGEPFYWASYEMFERSESKEYPGLTFYSDVLGEKEFDECVERTKFLSELKEGEVFEYVVMSQWQLDRRVIDYQNLLKLKECIVFKKKSECEDKDIVARIDKLALQYVERGSVPYATPNYFSGTRNLYTTILKEN